MKRWFFDEHDRVAALQLEAESWIGTPFREHSKAKGAAGGVDCVGLCECIELAAGVGGSLPFRFPRTPMDYSMHNDRSILLEYMRGEVWRDPQSARLKHIFAELPDVRELGHGVVIMPGDLLGFKIGRAVHHLAVALDDEHFIHAFRGIGTVIATLQDSTFASRLHTLFRARA